MLSPFPSPIIPVECVIKKAFLFSVLLQATTDLYGNCTLRHSGTSAAAPEAAGVFALALEAKYVLCLHTPAITVFIYLDGLSV